MKKRKWIAAAVAVIVIGGTVMVAVAKGNSIPSFPVTQVVKGDVETEINASGVVESEESKVYYALLNAKIDKVSVEKGDTVKAGDVLLTYDTEDLEFTQKEGALEALASESSYLSAIEESNKHQQTLNDSASTLEIVETMIDAQQTFINDLKNLLSDEKSKKRLKLLDEKYRLSRQQNGIAVNMEMEDGDISDSMWSANYEVKNKIAEVDKKLEELEFNKELTELERQIETEQQKLVDMEEMKADLKADKNAAENNVLNGNKKRELEAIAQKAKISEEKALSHLEDAKAGIVAEFPGVITELDVHDGFMAEESLKLMKIENTEKVRVTISLSKYDLEKVALGQKAEVEMAGNTYKGTISKINHMAEKNDAGSRLVTAQVHIENPDENIYLGIEGKVKIHAQKAENVLTVPFSAVNTDQFGDFCYVIANDIVEKRPVQVGLTSEDVMEIKEGLKEGDMVVTEISDEIEEGMEATCLK